MLVGLLRSCGSRDFAESVYKRGVSVIRATLLLLAVQPSKCDELLYATNSCLWTYRKTDKPIQISSSGVLSGKSTACRIGLLQLHGEIRRLCPGWSPHWRR